VEAVAADTDFVNRCGEVFGGQKRSPQAVFNIITAYGEHGFKNAAVIPNPDTRWKVT